MRLTYDTAGNGAVIATSVSAYPEVARVDFPDPAGWTYTAFQAAVAANPGRFKIIGAAGSRQLLDNGVVIASEESEGQAGTSVQTTGAPVTSWSRIAFKSAPWADPTHPDWGADPLGVTEASTALNAMFASVGAAKGRVVFPAGSNFRVTKNLYIPGTVDLQFEPGASITLDGDLGLSDGNQYFINLGLASKGAAATQWTGRWRDGTIFATANARVQRMIQVHSGANYWFSDMIVDVTANGDLNASGFAGYNDATWCTNPSRTRAHFDRVHVLGSQSNSGGEGIGHGSCSEIWVRDCLVDGMGDDALGLHSCDHITVGGFKGRTTHGRMYLSNPTDFTVDDFYIERIAKPSDGLYVGGGGLLELTIESSAGPAPSRGQITNGELVLTSVPSQTYMSRLRGLRDTDVNGLQLRCSTANGIGMSLESITTAGWSDPEGLDLSTKARVRNTTIKGVHTTGPVDVSIQQIGTSDDFVSPVTVDNSVVGPPLFYVPGTVWTPVNRIRSGNPADLLNLHGQCVPNAPLLFEGPVVCTSGGGAVKVQRASGLDRYYPRKAGVVTAYSLELASDQTSGDLFFGISKNGGAVIENIDNTSANPRGQTAYTYQVAGYQFASTDYLQAIIPISTFAPSPIQAWVKVYGIYV